ncbi:MAG: PqqD family protein [Chitinophagales bacterium]
MKLNSNLAVSDSGFLFNPTNGDSFSMNPVATEIITLLKAGKSVDQVKATLLEKYEVDKAMLERDMDEFLFELRDFKLVSE